MTNSSNVCNQQFNFIEWRYNIRTLLLLRLQQEESASGRRALHGSGSVSGSKFWQYTRKHIRRYERLSTARLLQMPKWNCRIRLLARHRLWHWGILICSNWPTLFSKSIFRSVFLRLDLLHNSNCLLWQILARTIRRVHYCCWLKDMCYLHCLLIIALLKFSVWLFLKSFLLTMLALLSKHFKSLALYLQYIVRLFILSNYCTWLLPIGPLAERSLAFPRLHMSSQFSHCSLLWFRVLRFAAFSPAGCFSDTGLCVRTGGSPVARAASRRLRRRARAHAALRGGVLDGGEPVRAGARGATCAARVVGHADRAEVTMVTRPYSYRAQLRTWCWYRRIHSHVVLLGTGSICIEWSSWTARSESRTASWASIVLNIGPSGKSFTKFGFPIITVRSCKYYCLAGFTVYTYGFS